MSEVKEVKEGASKAPEMILTKVTGIQNVYPTGTGTVNGFVNLACGGLALIRNMPSITVGQDIKVFAQQVVGNIAEAYNNGILDAAKRAAEKEKARLEKLNSMIKVVEDDLDIKKKEPTVKEPVVTPPGKQKKGKAKK